MITESGVSAALAHEEFYNDLRKNEFSRLESSGHVYLDYTGGGLYPQSLPAGHLAELQTTVYGNPHSTNPTSAFSTQLVEGARAKVLSYFHAGDDYYCIFTQNATGALNIVGENYPFGKDSYYLVLADNHNSVNGIREYCKRAGSGFSYAQICYEDLCIDEAGLLHQLESHPDKRNKLFAYPAQSNVTGVKHSLDWVERAQSLGWDVLLDAAAYVPCSELNLSKVRPQFVSISFYKMFGYPTGVGCLLVRKDVFPKLEKRWFAGGTVTAVSVLTPNHFLAGNHERFENGTVNYLSIPVIKTGLEFMEKVGGAKLTERVNSMLLYLMQRLREIRHDTGAPVVKMFGPEDRSQTGATVIMSFFNPDGTAVPFEHIEKMANSKRISIRSGCFCNPGIDEINHCLSTAELSSYFSDRTDGHYHDMIAVLGKMRGALRVSLGMATVQKDLDTFIGFVDGLRNLQARV